MSNSSKPVLKRVLMRSGAIAIVIFATASCSIAAEVDTFDDATSERVTELSKAGRCKEAWDIIWPYALNGSNRASGELLGEMAFGNIRPPLMIPTLLHDTEISKAKTEVLKFSADLAFFVDPKVSPEIATWKQSFLAIAWNKDTYSKYVQLNCLNGGDESVCLNPDRWLGLVTKLSAWNKKFEQYEKAGLAAGCWRK